MSESGLPGFESNPPFAARLPLSLSLCFPRSLHCICPIKPEKGQKMYIKKRNLQQSKQTQYILINFIV